MVNVTKHATKRIRERCGVNKKGTQRLAQIAMDKGLTHAETTGALKEWITSKYLIEERANNIRVYGDKCYMFRGEDLITILTLPTAQLREIANRNMQAKRMAV